MLCAAQSDAEKSVFEMWHNSSKNVFDAEVCKDAKDADFQTKTVISIAYARAHSSKFIPEEGDDLQPVTRLAALASLSVDSHIRALS